MAIVGATTSFLAGFGIEKHLRAGMLVAAAAGALIGSLFGIAFRRLLLAWLSLPIVAWIPISLALGGLWGGAIAAVTMLVTRDTEGFGVLSIFGAIAGALQLSWFWLPYAVRAGRGKSTWPLVAAAVIVGGAIGYAALGVMWAIWQPRFD